MKNKYAFPESLPGQEIREYRKSIGITQQTLADFAGVSKKTVERWESGSAAVKGPVIPLLIMLREDPEALEKYNIPPRKTPLRLYYMYKQEICTLIDVDERLRKVSIRNYTDKTQFRAFGNNTAPDFADYEEFLRQRCFPESRDKLKLVLKDLDLPFYDPLLIVEKTGGRMAEDDFRVVVER